MQSVKIYKIYLCEFQYLGVGQMVVGKREG